MAKTTRVTKWHVTHGEQQQHEGCWFPTIGKGPQCIAIHRYMVSRCHSTMPGINPSIVRLAYRMTLGSIGTTPGWHSGDGSQRHCFSFDRVGNFSNLHGGSSWKKFVRVRPALVHAECFVSRSMPGIMCLKSPCKSSTIHSWYDSTWLALNLICTFFSGAWPIKTRWFGVKSLPTIVRELTESLPLSTLEAYVSSTAKHRPSSIPQPKIKNSTWYGR